MSTFPKASPAVAATSRMTAALKLATRVTAPARIKKWASRANPSDNLQYDRECIPFRLGAQECDPYSDVLLHMPSPFVAFDESNSDGKPPEQTIYSCREAESAPLEIPLQTKHAGTKVILSGLADTLCCEMGVHMMLKQLCVLLGTDGRSSCEGIAAVLESFANSHHDFGMAYAFMRQIWFGGDPLTRKKKDEEMRASVVDRDRACISDPDIPPRRIWDLYAHRIVPWWLADLDLATYPVGAVSHAWMPEDKRHFVLTPINSHQWPVPIPKDTTLDRVRVELLNLGVEYAWLDVLCLRQASPGHTALEALRVEEWQLDVPTIGNIYQRAVKAIPYHSGLGRPFRVENSGSPTIQLGQRLILLLPIMTTSLSKNFIADFWTAVRYLSTSPRNRQKRHGVVSLS